MTLPPVYSTNFTAVKGATAVSSWTVPSGKVAVLKQFSLVIYPQAGEAVFQLSQNSPASTLWIDDYSSGGWVAVNLQGMWVQQAGGGWVFGGGFKYDASLNGYLLTVN